MKKDAKQQAIDGIVMKMKKKQIQNSNKIQIRPRCVSVCIHRNRCARVLPQQHEKKHQFRERASERVSVCVLFD